MRAWRPSFHQASPRFTPPLARGWVILIPAPGSNCQSSLPVAASKATTRELTVVTNMTPSMTIGVHSIVVPLPASPV
jgi:hypothetical protein